MRAQQRPLASRTRRLNWAWAPAAAAAGYVRPSFCKEGAWQALRSRYRLPGNRARPGTVTFRRSTYPLRGRGIPYPPCGRTRDERRSESHIRCYAPDDEQLNARRTVKGVKPTSATTATSPGRGTVLALIAPYTAARSSPTIGDRYNVLAGPISGDRMATFRGIAHAGGRLTRASSGCRDRARATRSAPPRRPG